jgi:hypothetical protein
VALFAVLHARSGRAAVSPLPLALGFFAALALVGGSHFSLEPIIGPTARRIAADLDICNETAPHRAEALMWRSGLFRRLD